jgi:hypothetical protein
VTRETAATANSIVARVDALVAELEDPIRALRPGIETVSEALNAPLVQRLPGILEAVDNTVVPVAQAAGRGRYWVLRLISRRPHVAQVRRLLALTPKDPEL